MFGEVGYVIGQILSIVAVILGFISYQMKTSQKILAIEIITALVFSAHYLLIGAPTAMALNLLGAVQCVVFYFRDKQGKKGWILPVIFSVITVATGIMTWDGWHSVLIMLGLVAYNLSIASQNAQIIRYAMFFKSPMCLAYNAIAFSVGGIIYECSVLISSVIGTVRYHKNKKKEILGNGKI